MPNYYTVQSNVKGSETKIFKGNRDSMLRACSSACTLGLVHHGVDIYSFPRMVVFKSYEGSDSNFTTMVGGQLNQKFRGRYLTTYLLELLKKEDLIEFELRFSRHNKPDFVLTFKKARIF